MDESTQLQSAALTKRLTILYITALSSIAMLTFGGQLVVQNAIVQLEGDSRIVNIAGRQRMLSQRLTRLTFEWKHSQLPTQAVRSSQNELVTRIRADLETWTQNHEGLQRGDEALQLPGKNSPSVQLLFNELNPHFEALRVAIESEMKDIAKEQTEEQTEEQGNTNRSKIGSHSDAFLAGMDKIVSLLEKEARDRVNRLRWIETALLVATIAVLLCEGFFVFSPAVASLRRSLTKLQMTSNELERAKVMAENASLAKTDFLSRVSHELRTPLHAILGMLGLVEQTKLKPEQRAKIRLAFEASTSLLSLVDDLLDVASIEQGREFAIHPHLVHLPELLTSTSEVMKPLALAKGLQFDLSLDKSLPNWISIDADRLRQVLTNLLQNAIRYTIVGGVRCNADIKMDVEQYLLRLTIEDTGIGISPLDQKRIFSSFHCGDSPQTQSEFGRRIGLGLTIAQAIVKKIDGTIELTSQVGTGSRFVVTLPVQIANSIEGNMAGLPQLVARVPSPSLGGLKKRLTALIVDDSPTNLLLMRSYLRQLGYRSMSVSSIKESIAKFKRHRFDIVLMDKNLADGDGLDFPQRLAGLLGTPDNGSSSFFLITAEISETQSRDPRLKAFARVLHKPISLSELQAALETNLAIKSGSAPESFAALKSKLANRFSESLPRDIESLRRMLNQSDYDGLAFLSHRMIGSAGNAGLAELATLSRNLNDASSERDRLRIELILSQLATHCNVL